ncbi:apolipoprotein apolipophorin [Nannochloropsis oceanica]
MDSIKAKLGEVAHVVSRKAKNTVEDVKHFAGDVGEKLKPAADKAGEVAQQTYESMKPGLEKAGTAISGATHDVIDKVKELGK